MNFVAATHVALFIAIASFSALALASAARFLARFLMTNVATPPPSSTNATAPTATPMIVPVGCLCGVNSAARACSDALLVERQQRILARLEWWRRRRGGLAGRERGSEGERGEAECEQLHSVRGWSRHP